MKNIKDLILAHLKVVSIASLREIAAGLGVDVQISKNRRSIQRALNQLITQNRVQRQGKARASVYSISRTETTETSLPITIANQFTSVPLTSRSTALLHYLSKSLASRTPVGYEKNFLLSYIPNQTFYLENNLRAELQKIGRVENVTRPAGTYARSILNRLLIDLSWNSSRLEGNTYSLLETKRLIELGEMPAGKDVTEAQMILNHKDAIEYIIDSTQNSQISTHDIRSLHALLSNNLLGDSMASGNVRTISVGISGTTYIPLSNTDQLREYLDEIIMKMNQITDPFEQSFFALVHLSYLQAFEDVNKRTGRLTANISLIKNNLKPLSFNDVNSTDYVTALLGVYEKNDISLLKDLYVWAYTKSAQRYTAIQQSMGEPDTYKIKYRLQIQEMIRSVVIENLSGDQLVSAIHQSIQNYHIPTEDAQRVFSLIETEIMSLHEGNIARFKIRPSEFASWKKAQHQ